MIQGPAAAAPILGLLLGMLLLAAAVRDGGEVCTDSDCLPEGDEAGLLQAVGRSERQRTRVDVDGAAGGEQQYPLAFQVFIGAASVGFQVHITASIDGLSYHMLLDTGSSTIALCNGTTDETGAFVPPSVPMPDGTPTGDAIALGYGDSETCHGWWGYGYTGTLTVGEVTTPTVYAVMQQKTGLRGQQCGIPEEGSLGAERLQGIFGFGGTALNGPWCPGATYTIDEVVQCSHPCPVTTTPETAPFQSILNASGSDAFSISWSGMLGASTGTLYTADASRLRLAQVSQTAGVRVQMTLDGYQKGSYSITPTGYALYTGPDFQELVTDSVAAPTCAGACIVDTGTTSTTIPSATLHALAAHFNVSDAPATIKIELVGADGSPVQLSLLVPKWMVVAAPLIQQSFFHAGDGGLIGLANWIWYEEAHFDVANGEVVFVPRDNITELLNELGSKVAAIEGAK